MKKYLSQFLIVLSFLTVVIMCGPSAVAADTYEIDVSHSTFGFSVSHLVVSKTRGSFGDFSGSLEIENGKLTAAKADIQVSSIDTKNKKRDDHLKASDFFDAAEYPRIRFSSTKIEPGKGENKYIITGNLVMKGVKKEVKIPVTLSGPVASPFGFQAIGLAGGLTINRQDFGISWNKAMDSGGVVVGDNVDILIELEAHK